MKKFSFWILSLTVLLLLLLLGTCTATNAVSQPETKASNAKTSINFILIGATGNLAEKYLWQSLFNIHRDGLKKNSKLNIYPTATSKESKGTSKLQKILKKGIKPESSTDSEKEALSDFLSTNVNPYHRLKSADDYIFLEAKIGKYLKDNNLIEASRIFYLSVPPKYFATIAFYLKEADLITKNSMIIVEKPFGHDMSSSQDLAANLFRFVPEGVVQLVDHYMGKRGMTALRDFRYYNEYPTEIENVEVVMYETEDVSGRGWFYKDVGVLRDTMQNHLMMMLSLFGADIKTHGETEGRLRFVKGLHESSIEDVRFLGQYSRYKQHLIEDDVPTRIAKSSKTPTYAELDLHVLRNGSALTPEKTRITLKSGKALDRRTAYIKADFVDGSTIVFNLQGNNDYINGTGLYLKQVRRTKWKLQLPPTWNLETKKKEGGYKTRVYRFDDANARVPQAYETLLRAAFEGDTTYFVNLREVMKSWRIFQGFLDASADIVPTIYKKGTKPDMVIKSFERDDL